MGSDTYGQSGVIQPKIQVVNMFILCIQENLYHLCEQTVPTPGGILTPLYYQVVSQSRVQHVGLKPFDIK
jgi:hypothetical protein